MKEFTGDYAIIPELTQGALQRYVEHRIPPGGFLTGVLNGSDVVTVMGRADTSNQIALPALCKYIYNELPCDCWGNKTIVEAWLKEGK